MREDGSQLLLLAGNDVIKRFLISGLFIVFAVVLLYQLDIRGSSADPTTVIYLPAIAEEISISDPAVSFAVIGDYGEAGAMEQAVAEMVKSWETDFIITTGDNNYDNGEAGSIDANVGQYFSETIFPYSGVYTPGTQVNRFFPSLGNHDWNQGQVQPYLDYFPISESPVNSGNSGNERYYDFVQGPVHFFVLDSDDKEPDGATASSKQAAWLEQQLAASTSPWKIVYFHHPPYSSGDHGPTIRMRWLFQEWGADAVLTGHEHDYERLLVDNFPYFVNGSGGRYLRDFKETAPGSVVRYNADHGAMLVRANAGTMVFEFYSIRNWQNPIDRFQLWVDKAAQ